MTQIPPLRAHGVEIPEIEAQRKEIHANHRELRMAEVRLTQLGNRREQAKVEDTRDAVAAKRAGKKDPGDKHQKKLEGEIEKGQREVDVLKGLQTELEQEAWELMREHSAEIIRALNENLENLNAIQLKAISQLETVRAERQGTLRALEMVGRFVPTEVPEAEGPGQDYWELSLNHNTSTLFKMDDQAIGRTLAQLKAEAGHREELESIAAQEQDTVDVFFPGTASLPQPEGYKLFLQRKAERTAERNGE
jgi:hypothetical protein